MNVGVETDDKEYPEMSPFVIQALSALRMAVGDLSSPAYSVWSKMLGESYYGAKTMIFLAWTNFALNIYLMVVVLLNFLIAVISQVYEET